ncbi:serine hydrolase domain-containing protein [Spirosoma montaniterrae]|uniref:Serine hydrolase n=1 Tax=Spirosoma montaniterrae TaxID=1178516 RepID=A0A1P9WW40_9BACT|nr:serine hydrolase [Spirosoma montaniterrae]AQG79594.1 serine hydrolase [Spirosoma montaniterrae]
MSLNRRLFLQQLGFGIAGLTFAPANTGWAVPTRSAKLPRSLPEAQGVASGGLLNFVNAVEKADLNLHSLMVVRHGRVIAEGWWAPYAPQRKHTLYSLSKSFTSTAVGMAVAEGRLTVDDKVTSFFKDDLPATVSDNLAAMRVKDLLTMSTGHERDTTATVRAFGNKNWPKAFLAQPVQRQPGTHFVYNSGATYMLSAIVQQLTGQTVLAYLKPRLFDPLGIEGADWEVDPTGVSTGGWGLRVRTEDIAKFGQLYLQQGVWQGKRLLPESWVADATREQILQPGTDRANSDWLQGYGYQFWRCRHDAYRGDGAFGQYCVVLPKQDTVIAITSETANMPAILNVVWEHILPALDGNGLITARAAATPLVQKLKSLSLPLPTGAVTSPIIPTVGGKTYTFDTNTLNAKSAALTFGKDECVFTLRDDRGDHRVMCGLNRWAEGSTTFSTMPLKLVQTPVPGETQSPVAATGTWQDPNTFVMTWRFIETAHYDTVTCHFADDRLTVAFQSSLSKINKTKDARPELVGRVGQGGLRG